VEAVCLCRAPWANAYGRPLIDDLGACRLLPGSRLPSPESPTTNEYALIALEAMFDTAHLPKASEFTPGRNKPWRFNTVRLVALTKISGKSLRATERALAFPLVVFAQLGLVFFHLGFEFAEGFLATGPHGGSGAGGVQRSGGQR
jgi:hypothetical protein